MCYNLLSWKGFKRGARLASFSCDQISIMFAWTLLAALLVVVGARINAAAKLTNYVTQCSLKDPKLDECLTTQSNVLLPYLVAGVKEWGIVSMDPLEVPLISLQYGGDTSPGLSANATDTSHYGWKDMDIKSVRFNPKTYEIEVNVLFPTYTVHGEYEVDGEIISLPIRGTGHMKAILDKVQTKYLVTCVPETRGGKTYLKIVDTTCEMSLKHIDFNFENLFGNEKLSDTMNEVLSENSLEVFKVLKVPAQTIFSDLFEGMLSKIFAKVPFDQFFKAKLT